MALSTNWRDFTSVYGLTTASDGYACSRSGSGVTGSKVAPVATIQQAITNLATTETCQLRNGYYPLPVSGLIVGTSLAKKVIGDGLSVIDGSGTNGITVSGSNTLDFYNLVITGIITFLNAQGQVGAVLPVHRIYDSYVYNNSGTIYCHADSISSFAHSKNLFLDNSTGVFYRDA